MSSAQSTNDDTSKMVDEENRQQDPILNEWDKAEKAATTTTSASVCPVEDMPPRQRLSYDSESWRHIDVKVKKTWAHRAFIWLVYISVSIHALMCISQVTGVYFFWMTSVQGIMRCYVILMTICAIFTELQFTKFIRESAILTVWITRGLFYFLIGIMALEQLDTEPEGKHWDAPGRSELVMFIQIMAYVMLGLGVLYYVMGCLCVQVYKTKVYADFEKRSLER